MFSLRPLALMSAPALLLATSAVAQVTIDSHGVRTPGTRIDASGVHTAGTNIDATGVHTGGAGGRVINGNHTMQRIDCAGGGLTVNGNHNQLDVVNCRTVAVAGNYNAVSAHFSAPGRLTVAGNHDAVTYSTAPRVAVAVSNVGTGSAVTRR